MRKYIVFLIIILVFNCKEIDKVVEGSDEIVTSNYDFINFSKISCNHTYNLSIEQNDNYNVTLKHNKNIDEYLIINQHDDNLTISIDPKYDYKNLKLEAKISLPMLTQASLSGASSLNFGDDPFFSDNLNFTLNGACTVKGTVFTDTLSADISGTSYIELAGESDNAIINLSGASSALLNQFITDNFVASGSGASNFTLFVDKELSVNLTGSSYLNYSGKAVIIEQNISGAAKITHRE